MKLRVIEKNNLFYPQYYNSNHGWRNFDVCDRTQQYFYDKELAIKFCEVELAKYKINVVWSSDEN